MPTKLAPTTEQEFHVSDSESVLTGFIPSRELEEEVNVSETELDETES